MTKSESQRTQPLDLQQLLDLRFTNAEFTLQPPAANRGDLTPVTEIYIDHLIDLGFVFSHEISVRQVVGKAANSTSRMLVYLNTDHHAYAIVTNLYHEKTWVYFTQYFTRDRRVITSCQPGSLQLQPMGRSAGSAGFHLENTGSGTLKSQWNKHQQKQTTRFPGEKPLLMDPHQHLDAERHAYRKYTELLLNCTILRQSDTQLLGFTQTGARSYQAAVSSKSAKRPNPAMEAWFGKRGKLSIKKRLNYRDMALAASAAILALIAFNLASFVKNSDPVEPTPVAVLPAKETTVEETIPAVATIEKTEPVQIELNAKVDESVAKDTNAEPEQFIVASEEDEMWRIAVENAEFYLMSNDGDPAPWIRTARKMAAGFNSDDPRLARTHFLAAMLEDDERVAEQQYNRALSIQTKSLGLYHAETAQTLEALAWVAEGTRDDLEDATTHQKLALNVYRRIFGEEAEDTRAARWKLQYFEDRLAGRRPKSDDNRRLLPALAKFAR